MNAFILAERLAQGAFLSQSAPELSGYNGSPWRLHKGSHRHNLAPSIRELVPAYFEDKKIHWHIHANHGLSSQICCLNFLAPLARRPAMLARLVRSVVGGGEIEMLPVEQGPDASDWYVGFEWIGGNHLNEAAGNKPRSRGANATSADAVVMFLRDGVRETLLIEWKYTESYGSPVDPSGNETRIGRYKEIAFAPSGPIRDDLGLVVEDFLWEPYYQLLRQQMLAWHMEKAREDGADLVRLLHLSPRGNMAIKTVTAPALKRFGSDLGSAWPNVLIRPDRFRSMAIGDLFQPLCIDCGQEGDWADYLSARYGSILMS